MTASTRFSFVDVFADAGPGGPDGVLAKQRDELLDELVALGVFEGGDDLRDGRDLGLDVSHSIHGSDPETSSRLNVNRRASLKR
jgi:hypothetical protein